MREIMRSLLSSNLTVTGIIMFAGSLVVFLGSTFLLNAPRGPAPASIDGLNAFEIRILPLTFLIGSTILFIMFLLALNRFEQEQIEKGEQQN